MLSSAYFKGKSKFVPDHESIGLSCYEKKVTVTTDPSNTLPPFRREPLREWVISARVQPTNLDLLSSFEYFLSYATFRTSDVYVYRKGPSDDVIVLENVFREVRFVLEAHPQNWVGQNISPN